ncbi:multi protein bridging factor 1-domain-containing protein [Syncephalis plumigaleata]|nr:multi protein bridging factor 1-domain-containing protein [Syncephalis plumigaleata]
MIPNRDHDTFKHLILPLLASLISFHSFLSIFISLVSLHCTHLPYIPHLITIDQPVTMADWDDVTVIRKRQEVPRATKSQSVLNQARRTGSVVATERKFTAGTNKRGADNHQHLAKIDNDEDIPKVETVKLSVGLAIQKGRQAKGWTQKDLGQRISEKANVINDYEAGRAIPSQQVLSKLQRTLGVKLLGKNIGEPLGGDKKK